MRVSAVGQDRWVPGQGKPGADRPSGSLPTTGDGSMLVVAGVGAIAVAAIVAGVILVARHRRAD